MKHIISVLVENKFGTLNRVATMFSARGFNLASISIGETEDPEISRMTIVTFADDQIINQVIKQLNRLVDTIKVTDLTKQPHVERELLLMTLKLSKTQQHEIFELINVFKGKVVDIGVSPFRRCCNTPWRVTPLYCIINQNHFSDECLLR